MGKFNFNHVTDRAKDELDKSNVHYVVEENKTVSIFTNVVDYIQDDLMERDIDHAEYANVKERIKQQALRHWYCKDTKRYYYLIEDKVYEAWREEIKDYSTTPPTIFVETIFDHMKEPGSIEDILRARHPSFSGHHAFY